MIKPAKTSVSFGKALDLERYRKDRASRETYLGIGKEIMAGIAKLRDNPAG